MLIAAVSEKYRISVDTLRYYERIGLIPFINRKNGIRYFTEEDCRWVEFAICMRSAGLSIEVLTEYVKLFQQGDDTIEDRKQLLKEQRNLLQYKVIELQKTLARLDKKIENYDQTLARKEQLLSNVMVSPL